jgi:hypothetical protein
MNRSTPLLALGLIFAFVGVGVYLFTLKKPTFPPARNKGELRERAVLVENHRKLRIAAGIAVGFGALLILIS